MSCLCVTVESSPLDHEEESDEESEMAPNIGKGRMIVVTVILILGLLFFFDMQEQQPSH